MKNSLSLFLLLSLLLTSISGCKDEKSQNRKQQQEQRALTNFLEEIKAMANQVPCVDATAWKFVAIGSKSCGGPSGYIAYPKAINESIFLNKVKLYTKKEKAFDQKWGLISTCSITPKPTSVECVNGKPKLVY